MTLQTPSEVIANYLNECDVEEFVDDEFSAGAARDIIGLLEDAGYVIAFAPLPSTKTAKLPEAT